MKSVHVGDQSYTIGNVVAINKFYTVKECWDINGRELLIKIAANPDKNQYVLRDSRIRNKLRKAAIELPNYEKYNYHLGIPEVIGDFVGDQNSLHATIIAFENVTKLSELIPLIKIFKNNCVVDLYSSFVIISRLLKSLQFAYSHNISPNNITSNNIIICGDKHYVYFFDWSDAQTYSAGVPVDTIRDEIKIIANITRRSFGDIDINDADKPYVDYIDRLAGFGSTNISTVISDLLSLVDVLCDKRGSTFKRGFSPFIIRENHGS